VFLLTIVVGTLVQWLVAVAVLGPLELRDAKSRADWRHEGARHRSGPRSRDRRSIREIRASPARGGPQSGRVVHRAADGRVIAPGLFLVAVLGADVAPIRRNAARPPSSRAAARRDVATRISRRFEVLARRDDARRRTAQRLVVRAGRPPLGFAGFRSPTPLLFLPITVIASAVAGLFMVRILVRRLRKLETLAARVADGDLSARIDDRSGDEIGRVAEGLDRMTTRLAEARERVEETDAQPSPPGGRRTTGDPATSIRRPRRRSSIRRRRPRRSERDNGRHPRRVSRMDT
jgi:HAMP domain-containing protein